eukprot:m.27913 g.27913  ORF g.27913 m.27913 type:complete len:739 (+) comp8668_c0_seq1:36-2252(+)
MAAAVAAAARSARACLSGLYRPCARLLASSAQHVTVVAKTVSTGAPHLSTRAQPQLWASASPVRCFQHFVGVPSRHATKHLKSMHTMSRVNYQAQAVVRALATAQQHAWATTPAAVLVSRHIVDWVSGRQPLPWQPVRCQSRGRLARAESQHKSAGDTQVTLSWTQLWSVLQPDWLLLLAAVITAMAAAAANIGIPLAIGELVNALAAHATPALLRPAALRALGLYVVQATLTCSYITLLSVVGERLCERLRNMYFAAMVAQDIGFFDTHKSGEILSRLTTDIQEFKSSFKQSVSLGLRNATQVVGGLVSMFLVSPTLTTVLVTTVPAIILCGTLLGSRLRVWSRESQKATSDATGAANEIITNVRTVRASATEELEVEQYAERTAQCRRLSIRLGFGIGVFSGLSNLFVNGLVLGVLYYGGTLMSSNKLTPGELMSFLVSAQTIQKSMGTMSALLGQVVRGSSAASRVFEYLDMKPLVPITGGRRLAQGDLRGDIQFVQVDFAYPSRKTNVLQGFNFHVPAGKVVALCGMSGGGKSTIASLVERFYDPQAGHILLDGHDLRTIDPSWLRGDVIGYINQEPVLFARSIYDNIRYGHPDATPEQVYQAAREANAHDFIEAFPRGYDTVVGERGVTLSGGQRQRVSIARALLKNPRILILDEATSALDAESEKLVQSALDRVTKGRTVLVIAHRLSTIQNADVIAVLSNGRVVEKGSHASLLKAGGAYRELIQHQLSVAG